MQVVVGSQNPVKRDAVHQAFNKYFDEVEVIPVKVDSGVQPFPMSQTETLQGAINRAQEAQKKEPSADFSVGIEGGLFVFNDATYIQAIAAVFHANQICVAPSVAVEVSKTLVASLDPSSDESKKTVDQLLGRTNLFQNEGVIGVLTQNKLSRTQVLQDAVICALPRFLLPDYYPDRK
jgi:inosine/xanthosine triphosphatase